MKRIVDVKETVNSAIKFVQSVPCYICMYGNPKDNSCLAGVKYKGTCKVFRKLKGELLKMREVNDGD